MLIQYVGYIRCAIHILTGSHAPTVLGQDDATFSNTSRAQALACHLDSPGFTSNKNMMKLDETRCHSDVIVFVNMFNASHENELFALSPRAKTFRNR